MGTGLLPRLTSAASRRPWLRCPHSASAPLKDAFVRPPCQARRLTTLDPSAASPRAWLLEDCWAPEIGFTTVESTSVREPRHPLDQG